VGKGLAGAGHLGELVVFDLATIRTFYTNDPSAGKAQNNAAEIISGIVSGVLALEIPNVKNCKIHIGDFDHKVNQLDLGHNDMGKKLAKLREKIADMEQKIGSVKAMKGGQRYHKKLSNTDVLKKLDELIKESGAAYSALFEQVPQAKQIVDVYRKMSADWLKTLGEYEKNTSGWTKHVSTLAALATEAGLGMGHIGGEHVEGAVEIANQHLKLGLEAGTIVMNGLSDKVLELLGE
jgi:hypothetical protein